MNVPTKEVLRVVLEFSDASIKVYEILSSISYLLIGMLKIV